MRSLCAIADVSRKCYYGYLKRIAIDNPELQQILLFMRNIQQETYFAVGYRQMTEQIRKDLGIIVNKKRVLGLMARHDLLSVVDSRFLVLSNPNYCIEKTG